MSRLSFARRLARGNRGALPAVPPPVPVDGPPRLRICCGRDLSGRPHPGTWWWRITSAAGERIDGGIAATHGEALAVGLAALDAARAAVKPCA